MFVHVSAAIKIKYKHNHTQNINMTSMRTMASQPASYLKLHVRT